MAMLELGVEIQLTTFQEAVMERLSKLEEELLLSRSATKETNVEYFKLVEKFNEVSSELDEYKAKFGELNPHRAPDSDDDLLVG